MIGIFGVVSIAAAVAYKHSPRNWNWKAFAPFALLFGLILIRTVIGNCSAEDHFYLEKSLSLLLLPLFFALTPIVYGKKDVMTFMLLFAFATILMAIAGMAMVGIYFNEQIGISGKWMNWNELLHHPDFSFFIRTAFEDKTSFHPTYASLYLGIAFNVFLYDLLTNNAPFKISKGLSAIFLMGLALFAEITLASRTPFVATFIGAIFIVSTQMKNKKFVLPIIVGLALIGWQGSKLSPSIASRMNEVSIHNVTVPKAGHEDSFNLRRGILHCSFEIIKENWLFGVGPGKVQRNLDNCYEGFDKEVYKDRFYNTHNQYLDYWAGMGIFGPLALLFLLVISFWKCINLNLGVGMSICVMFAICMLTENLLIRQYGIVAFSYFLCLFSFINRRNTI